jgi:hypothetical protein
MNMFDHRSGAGIACIVCGARPFPELGPRGVREEYDLLKLGEVRGEDDKVKWWSVIGCGSAFWFCPRHRHLKKGSTSHFDVDVFAGKTS